MKQEIKELLAALFGIAVAALLFADLIWGLEELGSPLDFGQIVGTGAVLVMVVATIMGRLGIMMIAGLCAIWMASALETDRIAERLETVAERLEAVQ